MLHSFQLRVTYKIWTYRLLVVNVILLVYAWTSLYYHPEHGAWQIYFIAGTKLGRAAAVHMYSYSIKISVIACIKMLVSLLCVLMCNV